MEAQKVKPQTERDFVTNWEIIEGKPPFRDAVVGAAKRKLSQEKELESDLFGVMGRQEDEHRVIESSQDGAIRPTQRPQRSTDTKEDVQHTGSITLKAIPSSMSRKEKEEMAAMINAHGFAHMAIFSRPSAQQVYLRGYKGRRSP